jgi:hypothetical protein
MRIRIPRGHQWLYDLSVVQIQKTDLAGLQNTANEILSISADDETTTCHRGRTK